jgi:hypothetical protein
VAGGGGHGEVEGKGGGGAGRMRGCRAAGRRGYDEGLMTATRTQGVRARGVRGVRGTSGARGARAAHAASLIDATRGVKHTRRH